MLSCPEDQGTLLWMWHECRLMTYLCVLRKLTYLGLWFYSCLIRSEMILYVGEETGKEMMDNLLGPWQFSHIISSNAHKSGWHVLEFSFYRGENGGPQRGWSNSFQCRQQVGKLRCGWLGHHSTLSGRWNPKWWVPGPASWNFLVDLLMMSFFTC